jgi:hypothetical protein
MHHTPPSRETVGFLTSVHPYITILHYVDEAIRLDNVLPQI